MAAHTEVVQFDGLAGKIDCAFDWPEQEPVGWALVLHPNPAQGGARDNKVVTTIARACVQHQLVTVRPNFRGVGLSEGVFDNGQGEMLDMAALVEQFRVRYPELAIGKWVFGGFSFGTSIALQMYALWQTQNRPLPQLIILAGSAALRFRHHASAVPSDALVIHGELDDIVPLAEVFEWARPLDLPITVIPDTGHFFHGKLLILRQLLQTRLKTL